MWLIDFPQCYAVMLRAEEREDEPAAEPIIICSHFIDDAHEIVERNYLIPNCLSACMCVGSGYGYRPTAFVCVFVHGESSAT